MTAAERPHSEVTVPVEALAPFRRLSLYNSPYPAHDRGHAIDLYPDSNTGYSPVSGTVLETRTVRTPQKSYAVEHDHLILVDCDEEWCAAAGVETVVARVLHVDPGVRSGDSVEVGDSLGEMVRSGFFAPWVDNHVHLGFRTPEQNLQRASGSLPLELPVTPTPVAWDGRGTVVETGGTYAVLDRPVHPGKGWCGLAGMGSETAAHGVVDGGFPHYDGGGFFGENGGGPVATGPVSLLGQVIGDREGRTVTWRTRSVRMNGTPVHGISLFLADSEPMGVKVVCPDHGFSVGDEVRVTVGEESAEA